MTIPHFDTLITLDYEVISSNEEELLKLNRPSMDSN